MIMNLNVSHGLNLEGTMSAWNRNTATLRFIEHYNSTFC